MKQACDVYGTTKVPIRKTHVTLSVEGVRDLDERWEAELSERAVQRLAKFIGRGMTAPNQSAGKAVQE